MTQADNLKYQQGNQMREARLSIHLLSTIRAVPGQRAALLEAVENGLKPLMEQQGWRLLSLFTNVSGTMNTVVALWEIGDLNSYHEGRAAVAAHPDFPAVRAALDACIADETLMLVDRKL